MPSPEAFFGFPMGADRQLATWDQIQQYFLAVAAASNRFVVPPDQRDPVAAKKLVDLLTQGAVEVHRAAAPFTADGRSYPAGTQLVMMAQPFRAYAKTLLERQDDPGRRPAGGGPPERPYDVAGWTLPFQMGVDVERVNDPFPLPPLARVDQGTIPPGLVDGDRRADLWLVAAPGNAGTLAINRVLSAGLDVPWLTNGGWYDGNELPGGIPPRPRS